MSIFLKVWLPPPFFPLKTAAVGPFPHACVLSIRSPRVTSAAFNLLSARICYGRAVNQSESTHTQLSQLRALLREMGSVLVCYSGGIDSALVLAIAHQELGSARAIALTAISPSLPQREREGAAAFARALGANHQFVESQEIHRPDYAKNAPDRCFHCKTELYEIAHAKAAQWGLAAIVNGTNCDDLGDYRPGLQAAQVAQIRSPLCEAGLAKRDVRAIAQLLGLDLWDKPASACLASRIPYGVQVTPARLKQVESLESTLHGLGFVQVRVRHHEEVARIEVPKSDLARLVSPEIAQQVEQAGRKAGFRYVTVDLQGYRTGSLNEALPHRALPVLS